MNAQPATSAETAAPTAAASTKASIATVNPAAMMRTLAIDIGIPLAAYYALHLLGVGDAPALLAATGIVALRIVVGGIRSRTLNPFATVMLTVFGLGGMLGLVTGDPTFLLLKNSITTGIVGVVFLVTTLYGRPLSLTAGQSFNPARSEEFAEQYRTNPHIRRGHRVTSIVWGTGLLVEALVRIPLVYLLPVSVMVGLGEVITIAAMVALAAWNVWYLRRSRARLAKPRT